MDIEEIEEWYDEEKEKLTEDYKKRLEKLKARQKIDSISEEDINKKPQAQEKDARAKDPFLDFVKEKEKLKKNYLNSLDKLRAKYELTSQKRINGDLKQHFRKHRIAMLKKRLAKPFEKLRERFEKKKKE